MARVEVLIGIVKNAIMLIDFALERQREEGMAAEQPVFDACREHFRPIMMTSMAAMAGTLPIVLGLGIGEARRWLAGSGAGRRTDLLADPHLYLTPVICLSADRLQQRFSHRLHVGAGALPNNPR